MVDGKCGSGGGLEKDEYLVFGHGEEIQETIEGGRA